jgi:hypothetical protein
MGEMRARADEDGNGTGGVDNPDDPYADLILATRQKVRGSCCWPACMPLRE